MARPTSYDLAPGNSATFLVQLPPELRKLRRSRYARLTIIAEPAARRRVRIKLDPRAR